ncbi:MAG: GNAT family N-acetyltransferase [Candidatus Hodarchaeota archaeon]
MKKIIRKVSEEDIDLLVEMYMTDVENHEQRAIEFAKDLIYRFKSIICVSNKQVFGCITWDTKGGLNDGVIELVTLGVKPNYQRLGIARELLLYLINEAKKFFSESGYKLRVIYLFMERSNEIAHRFYNFMGFREIAEIPSFYPHDDAKIWIKYF